MKDFVFSLDMHGCGVAATKMFLIALTKQSGYRHMRVDIEETPSLSSLSEIAFQEGVELIWKKVDDCSALLSNKEFPLLLVLKEEGDTHMVLLKRTVGKAFLIYDPSRGKRKIRKEELIKNWTGIYGAGTVKEERKCPYKKKQIIKTFTLIPAVIFSLLSSVALFAAFFFVNEEGNFLFSIIFFVFSAICAVLERIFAVKIMKKFDKKYLLRISSKEKERFKENFARYYSFKTSFFANTISLCRGIITVLGLSALTGINEPTFFASIAGLIIFHIFLSLSFKENFANREKRLEEMESLLFSKEETSESQMIAIQKIASESYNIGDIYSYIYIIRLIMIMVLALVPLFGSKNITLNFYLFHFFALFGISESLRPIITFFEHHSQREKDEAYFLAHFIDH